MTAIMTETLLNPDVIRINQDYRATPGAPVRLCGNKTLAWVRQLSDGSVAVAVPNLGVLPAKLTVCFADLGLGASASVRDVWQKKDLGKLSTSVSATVRVHDTFLVIASPASPVATV